MWLPRTSVEVLTQWRLSWRWMMPAVSWMLTGFIHGQEEIAPAPKAERPVINFSTIEQQRFDYGDRSIIFNRVAPPQLPARPPQAAQATSEISPEAREIMLQRAAKEYEFSFLSATVYDRRITELRWFEGKKEYVAFSNIDFNYFSGIGEFETADTIYSYFMFIGNETAEGLAERNKRGGAITSRPVSDLARLPAGKSTYLMAEGSLSDSPRMQAALDAMHAYYDANREQLISEYMQREAANAEQKQWLREHPPVPKDTVIQFWPKKSRVYLGSEQ